jgi:hypothetical protein
MAQEAMLDSGMLLTGDHPRDYVEVPHIMAGRETPGAIGNNPSSSPTDGENW